MAKLDVLLAVKNGMPFIEEAINSMLGQTFGDFSLLVIDDASEDGTPSVVARLAKEDSRIFVVSAEGAGQIDALNQGLAWSESPYVARMDADDISLPHRFERQLSYLEAHPETSVVGSWVQPIDTAGRSLGAVVKYPTAPSDLQQHLLSNRNPLAHPAIMMRSGPAKELGGYRAPMKAAEDFDLWLRIAEMSGLANLSEVLLRYRVHPKQLSAAHRLDQCFSAELAFLCSEIRKSGMVDPVDVIGKSEDWTRDLGQCGPPLVKDLCDRFAALRHLAEDAPCQGDALRSALDKIKVFHHSMAINHRLYADISARIAAQSILRGNLLMALRASLVGMRNNPGRFSKASLRHVTAGW